MTCKSIKNQTGIIHKTENIHKDFAMNVLFVVFGCADFGN